MQIELSLDRFLELYRLVALGRLIQGLVHNLNGPLQNLGMDMEMMESNLGNEKNLPGDLRESILHRLRRMEGEFDRIIHMIKSASSRIGMEGEYGHYVSFDAFLEEEISFLNANLYFKHNVQKEIRVAAGLPPLDRFPPAVVLSISWLMQALVEEIERGNAKLFSLKASAHPSVVEISFALEGESLPAFPDGLVPNLPLPEPLMMEEPVSLRMPLTLLKIHGTEMTWGSEPTKLTLTLRIPFS